MDIDIDMGMDIDMHVYVNMDKLPGEVKWPTGHFLKVWPAKVPNSPSLGLSLLLPFWKMINPNMWEHPSQTPATKLTENLKDTLQLKS